MPSSMRDRRIRQPLSKRNYIVRPAEDFTPCGLYAPGGWRLYQESLGRSRRNSQKENARQSRSWLLHGCNGSPGILQLTKISRSDREQKSQDSTNRVGCTKEAFGKKSQV